MMNIFSVLSVCVIATVLSAEPPNIILILADDVGVLGGVLWITSPYAEY